MNEKSFAEIQAMTPGEQRQYYKQRQKTTNSPPVKKVRGPTRRIERRKKRREVNRNIRTKEYDRPFDGNPQYNPKVIVSNKRKTAKMLRRLGYRTPIPSQ